MYNISTIGDVINLWPSRKVLADDLSKFTHVTPDRVHKWAKAGIPARYHFALVAAAQARGFSITADLLARLHAAPKDDVFTNTAEKDTAA